MFNIIKKNRFFKTLKKLAVNKDYVAIHVLCRKNIKYTYCGRMAKLAQSIGRLNVKLTRTLKSIEEKGEYSYEYEHVLPETEHRIQRADDKLLAILKRC